MVTRQETGLSAGWPASCVSVAGPSTLRRAMAETSLRSSCRRQGQMLEHWWRDESANFVKMTVRSPSSLSAQVSPVTQRTAKQLGRCCWPPTKRFIRRRVATKNFPRGNNFGIVDSCPVAKLSLGVASRGRGVLRCEASASPLWPNWEMARRRTEPDPSPGTRTLSS
jgi:hypothetical protein